MQRLILTGLATVCLVTVALVAGRAEAAPSRSTGSLVGTGATFPFPLISKWIPEVGKALGIDVTYSPTGSGAGIAGVTARSVDFGASDAPLSPSQLTACKGCVVIPWAVSALAVPYNLPGLGNCVLRLTPQTLSGIYLGEITTWSDPRIEASNPSCTLPDLKITPVSRSDGSGSTYAFTEYLSTVNATWRSKVGFNTSVSWPTGVSARGSSGVAGVVSKTPGALTYVDVAYALHNELRFAWVRNRAGRFASPGLRGIQAALSQVPKRITSLSQLNISDPPASAGRLAYPIGTFTYVVIPTRSAKAADLRRFVYWAVTQGQRFGPPLLFAPLPAPVQAFAYREIKKVQAAA